MDINLYFVGKIICVRFEVVVFKLNNFFLILWEEFFNKLFKIININLVELSFLELVLICVMNLKIKWFDNLMWIIVCW